MQASDPGGRISDSIRGVWHRLFGAAALVPCPANRFFPASLPYFQPRLYASFSTFVPVDSCAGRKSTHRRVRQ